MGPSVGVFFYLDPGEKQMFPKDLIDKLPAEGQVLLMGLEAEHQRRALLETWRTLSAAGVQLMIMMRDKQDQDMLDKINQLTEDLRQHTSDHSPYTWDQEERMRKDACCTILASCDMLAEIVDPDEKLLLRFSEPEKAEEMFEKIQKMAEEHDKD